MSTLRVDTLESLSTGKQVQVDGLFGREDLSSAEVVTSTGTQTLSDALDARIANGGEGDVNVTSTGSSSPVLLSNRFARTVKVMDFGAVGDGVTDDTVAFANAVAYAESQNKPLDLEGQSYAIGEIDTSGVSILSDGHSVINKLVGAGWVINTDGSHNSIWKGFAINGQNDTGSAFTFNSAGHVQLLDISLMNWVDRVAFFELGVDSALVRGGVVKDSSSSDIYSYKASNGKFQGIIFQDCDEHVIRFGRFHPDPVSTSLNNLVEACHFINIGNDAILFELDTRRGVVDSCIARDSRRLVKVEKSADANTRDFVVSNNLFSSSPGAVSNGEAIKGLEVDGMVVTGNNLATPFQGISVGSRGVVSGNYISNTTSHGIMYGDFCTISGNLLYGIGANGIHPAPSSGTGNYTSITGNNLNDVVGRGIVAVATNMVITGNITEASDIGIQLTSTSTRVVCTSNNVFGSATGITNNGTGNVLGNNIT